MVRHSIVSTLTSCRQAVLRYRNDWVLASRVFFRAPDRQMARDARLLHTKAILQSASCSAFHQWISL